MNPFLILAKYGYVECRLVNDMYQITKAGKTVYIANDLNDLHAFANAINQVNQIGASIDY
jgi:predicted transcriptional regulator